MAERKDDGDDDAHEGQTGEGDGSNLCAADVTLPDMCRGAACADRGGKTGWLGWELDGGCGGMREAEGVVARILILEDVACHSPSRCS